MLSDQHQSPASISERNALATQTMTGSFVRGLVVLRTFLGIVYLTNGLAKVFEFHSVSIWFWKFYLIDRADAFGIQKSNTAASPGFIRDIGKVVVDNWDVLQWLLTVGEVSVGVALIAGLFGRITALLGLGLALAPFIFSLGSHIWAYDYLFEPMLFVVLIAAGVLPRLDGILPMGGSRRQTGQPSGSGAL